ncbi:MAG: hypothetical protein ACRC0X_06060 [Brevinema sp.]
MKRLIVILLLLITSYTQAQSTKTLELYMQANSGNVNPNALPVFAINFAKYGLKYSEQINLWFRYYLMLELKTDLSFEYLEERPTIPGKVHMWNLDEYLIEGGVQFGNNFIVAFNNLGRFDLELYHIFRLPDRQNIRIGTELEVLALGGMLSAQPIKEKPSIPFDPVARPKFDKVINYFGIYLTYNIVFAPQWVFLTQLNPRFTGDDTSTFRNQLQLRWNNGITYNSPKGWTLNGIIRYQGQNLHTSKPLHNVLFIGRIVVKFDFSNK